MVNGVPTWETNTGAATLGHVSVSDIERIEVLKGPASVLYGTNAYVGAVNLVLKEPPEGQDGYGVLYGGAGEYNGIRGGANYNLSYNDLDLFRRSTVIRKMAAWKPLPTRPVSPVIISIFAIIKTFP